MEIKVTVELENGMKCTKTTKIGTDLVIVGTSHFKENPKPIRQEISKAAEDAACSAMRRIFNVIDLTCDIVGHITYIDDDGTCKFYELLDLNKEIPQDILDKHHKYIKGKFIRFLDENNKLPDRRSDNIEERRLSQITPMYHKKLKLKERYFDKDLADRVGRLLGTTPEEFGD